MVSLRMKHSNMTLTEKLQKYQPYQQVKLINMNILQLKKSSNQRQMIGATFTCFSLGKVFKKQKQFKIKERKSLKSFNIFRIF